MAAPKNPGGNAGKGRPKGQPNRATRELKELAGQYTEEAVLALAEVMREAEAPHASRVAASVALLDRAHGKPAQTTEITGKDGKDLMPPQADPSRVALAILNVLSAAKKPGGEAGEGETAPDRPE